VKEKYPPQTNEKAHSETEDDADSNSNNDEIILSCGGKNSFTASNNVEDSSSIVEDLSAEAVIPDSIYQAYGDTWACKNPGCIVKGDKWFMIKHPEHCRGVK
jgi:hypothetical protein